MQTNTHEIADRVYRLSTCVPDAAPGGFTFNQFLIDADEPLLFPYRPHGACFRSFRRRWPASFPSRGCGGSPSGHVESDECGAMNEFLAAAPRAEVAHGALGCMVRLKICATDRPRKLADGEVPRSRWQARSAHRYSARSAQLGSADSVRGNDYNPLLRRSVHPHRRRSCTYQRRHRWARARCRRNLPFHGAFGRYREDDSPACSTSPADAGAHARLIDTSPLRRILLGLADAYDSMIRQG